MGLQIETMRAAPIRHNLQFLLLLKFFQIANQTLLFFVRPIQIEKMSNSMDLA